MQILYRNICLACFIYVICFSQAGDYNATDHSHRLLFEYLWFKPMGIVFYLANYKMRYLKTALLLAKMKSIKRKQKIAQNL